MLFACWLWFLLLADAQTSATRTQADCSSDNNLGSCGSAQVATKGAVQVQAEVISCEMQTRFVLGRASIGSFLLRLECWGCRQQAVRCMLRVSELPDLSEAVLFSIGEHLGQTCGHVHIAPRRHPLLCCVSKPTGPQLNGEWSIQPYKAQRTCRDIL